MTSRVIPVAPFVLTGFGATGDLARRKLLPALFHRDFAGQLPEAAPIIELSQSSNDCFWRILLEKVPNCSVTDFPPNDEMSDNRSSMCPQTRYRSQR